MLRADDTLIWVPHLGNGHLLVKSVAREGDDLQPVQQGGWHLRQSVTSRHKGHLPAGKAQYVTSGQTSRATPDYKGVVDSYLPDF